MELEPKELAHILKSTGHPARIEILDILSVEQGLSVGDVSETLGLDIKSTSAHLQKLNHAELIEKKQNGQLVNIYLTNRGKKMHKLLKSLQ